MGYNIGQRRVRRLTNEEKILEMLASIQADMNGMKADIGELKADVSNLKTEAIKTNLRIENEIIPKLKVLAEGHAMLSETLAPKSKVDELQSDVELLKIVVKNLNSEVQQLKKAQ